MINKWLDRQEKSKSYSLRQWCCANSLFFWKTYSVSRMAFCLAPWPSAPHFSWMFHFCSPANSRPVALEGARNAQCLSKPWELLFWEPASHISCDILTSIHIPFQMQFCPTTDDVRICTRVALDWLTRYLFLCSRPSPEPGWVRLLYNWRHG